MIARLLCRLIGHRPLTEGSIYGACHRCGEMIRARPKPPAKTINAIRVMKPRNTK